MIRTSTTLVILICLSTANEIVINPDGSQPHQSVETSFLERARKLTVPIASGIENSAYEHASFWDDNGSLLREAWQEWEDQSSLDVPRGEEEFINSFLSTAIRKTFANPSVENENVLRSLWSSTYNDSENRIQPLPEGVYATTLLTPSGISMLRSLLDQSAESGIPTRRPNGMNRNGFILDRKVNGAVPISPLIDFVEEIIDQIVRPVGRMLFPGFVGCNDDIEYFTFTIRYDGDEPKAGMPQDVKLNEHRDASVITMNMNLNLPDERYSGSDVYFREFLGSDSITAETNTTSFIQFTPGMAVIHLGAHRHGSSAISSTTDGDDNSGTRYNLVIWLFGKDGDVRVAPYSTEEQMNVVERWHGCESVRGVISNIHSS